mmetsp:Transcript_1011/g.3339  ORF Transcript_1011/g.3339 Transcript_1011/m.3339 type:complete len:423 (-) Transcript_1011:215-1483(-)
MGLGEAAWATDAKLLGWTHRETVFIQVAEDAMAGHCKVSRRRPLQSFQRADIRAPNWTDDFLGYDPGPWQPMASNAVAALTDTALAVRTYCAVLVSRCTEILGTWGAAWCLFVRKMQAAAKVLPPAGLIVSALDTSAAALLREALPWALIMPLSGLATGKAPLESSLVMVQNTTLVFAEYVEHALVLGEEASVFGRSRVIRARFHGDAADAGVPEGRMLRSDVLLWLLGATPGNVGNGAPGWTPASRAPWVVELGVEGGECGARLLEGHATLRWLGVDKYDDSTDRPEHDPDSPHGRDTVSLLRARSRLRPWLRSRAQLLLGQTVEAAALWGEHPVDLLFVDADHSEAAVTADLAAWAPHVRPGGVVAGHDYCRAFPGVIRAVHAALPRGSTLHLAPDMVFWWRAPQGNKSGTLRPRQLSWR